MRDFFDVWRGEIVDVASRAAKTFIQTAAAAGLLGTALGGDLAAVRSILLAATAAALSVIWNAAVTWANS